MNIGSLYQTKELYWFLYPSREKVAYARHHVAVTVANAATAANAAYVTSYWSKVLDCNVSHIAEKSLFMLLEKDNDSCKILTTDGNIGWFAYSEGAEWSKDCIEEVNHVHS